MTMNRSEIEFIIAKPLTRECTKLQQTKRYGGNGGQLAQRLAKLATDALMEQLKDLAPAEAPVVGHSPMERIAVALEGLLAEVTKQGEPFTQEHKPDEEEDEDPEGDGELLDPPALVTQQGREVLRRAQVNGSADEETEQS